MRPGIEALEAKFQRMAETLVAGDAPDRARSVVLRVDAPSFGVSIGAAAGEARPDTHAPMEPGTRYHLASIAKTMTAVLILQLAEEGAFGAAGVEARLADIDALPDGLAGRLHAFGGRSFGERLTLRHLLTHASGMKDAMIDDGGGVAENGAPRPNSIIGRMISDPAAFAQKRWAPFDETRPDDPLAGTINYYLNADRIAEAALFAPGEGFHYSDSAFAVLGLVAERCGGAPLDALLSKRIFKPLGFSQTYLAYRNDPPLGPARDPEAEIHFGANALLSNGADLSFDWGGGGVVSTAEELNRFFIALSRGALFKHPQTFRTMTDWRTPPGLAAPRTGVGCGLFRTQSSCGELWGHSGAWGGKSFYSPRYGVFFSGSTNQASSPKDWHEPFLAVAIEKITGGRRA